MHRRADGAYSMVERRTTHTERGRRRRSQQDDIRRKGSKQVASARDEAVGGGEGGLGLSRRPRRLLSQPTLPTAQQHDVTRIPCESRFSMPGCDLHPSARQGRGPGEIQTVRFGKPPCPQQALPRPLTTFVRGRASSIGSKPAGEVADSACLVVETRLTRYRVAPGICDCQSQSLGVMVAGMGFFDQLAQKQQANKTALQDLLTMQLI
ncbi:uncharacterized protein BKA78DRAFT_293269 [Phyllosticta capitalensis]|uniref:uncharacterized protein n=1 Tax=Phyllosticta capitalensis TaxID=121624 RepID=UPI00312FA070